MAVVAPDHLLVVVLSWLQTLNAVSLTQFVPGLSLVRSIQNDLTARMIGTVATPVARCHHRHWREQSRLANRSSAAGKRSPKRDTNRMSQRGWLANRRSGPTVAS